MTAVEGIHVFVTREVIAVEGIIGLMTFSKLLLVAVVFLRKTHGSTTNSYFSEQYSSSHWIGFTAAKKLKGHSLRKNDAVLLLNCSKPTAMNASTAISWSQCFRDERRLDLSGGLHCFLNQASILEFDSRDCERTILFGQSTHPKINPMMIPMINPTINLSSVLRTT